MGFRLGRGKCSFCFGSKFDRVLLADVSFEGAVVSVCANRVGVLTLNPKP